MGPEDVEAVAAPVARDRAWLVHGGSGRRALQVLIDDHLQASFEFDAGDSLVAFSVFERRATWLKRPGNVLVHGAPDGEEMILLAE